MEWHEAGCKEVQYKYKKDSVRILRQREKEKDNDEEEENDDEDAVFSQLTAEAALTTLRKISEEDCRRLGFTR